MARAPVVAPAAGEPVASAAGVAPGTGVPAAEDTLGSPEEYDFPQVGDSMWGMHYLFTTHENISKEAFLAAVRAAYRAVFPVGHACYAGPQHAPVAREIGRQRPRRPHLHLAGAFGARHRWRQVRRELRETHGIEARLQTFR